MSRIRIPENIPKTKTIWHWMWSFFDDSECTLGFQNNCNKQRITIFLAITGKLIDRDLGAIDFQVTKCTVLKYSVYTPLAKQTKITSANNMFVIFPKSVP